MAFADDLRSDVAEVFELKWNTRDGRKVPEPEDIQLGNHAVKMHATVIYADLVGSTRLVATKKDWFAAEIHKTFLRCAAKVIRHRGGVITSYDGDRIMGVFLGKSKNTSAATAALNINWCMSELVSSLAKKRYPDQKEESFCHVSGVDTSALFVARTGVRGSNDLVWIGRAANNAAKLSDIRDGSHASWISEDVFGKLADEAKHSKDGESMWSRHTWKATGDTIYGSKWWWKP